MRPAVPAGRPKRARPWLLGANHPARGPAHNRFAPSPPEKRPLHGHRYQPRMCHIRSELWKFRLAYAGLPPVRRPTLQATDCRPLGYEASYASCWNGCAQEGRQLGPPALIPAPSGLKLAGETRLGPRPQTSGGIRYSGRTSESPDSYCTAGPSQDPTGAPEGAKSRHPTCRPARSRGSHSSQRRPIGTPPGPATQVTKCLASRSDPP